MGWFVVFSVQTVFGYIIYSKRSVIPYNDRKECTGGSREAAKEFVERCGKEQSEKQSKKLGEKQSE